MTPLCEKLQQHINVLCDKPVKESFLDIWKKLEADYDQMVKALVAHLQDNLGQWGIVAVVEGRAKAVDSVKKSIERREAHRMREQNKDEYKHLDEILSDLHDLAATRIVLDYRDDTDTVNKLITSTFRPVSEPNVVSRARKVGTNWDTWFGAYESWNHYVTLNPAATVDNLMSYCDITFEIQLTTLSESLYNKLAHPLIYKPSPGTLSREQEMMVDVAHGSAMIYAMCVLCLREKKRELSDDEPEQDALRDAARKVVGNDGSDQDNELLADLVSGGRNPLAGQTMPGRALLAAKSPPLTKSTENLQQWISNSIRTALDEIKNTPQICLPTMEQARFDTEEARRNRCHSGTRVEVLSKIRSWARKPAKETLLWLQAPAGTGKSTIARTLPDVFPADGPEKLVAGYLFKRGDAQRNLTDFVFPTIASQLVEIIPQFSGFLRKSIGNLAAVGKENAIQNKSLDEQFKMLINNPLSELNAVNHDDGCVRVIAIDALDECTDLIGIERVLELLSSAASLQLRLRVIVTSRPTARILDTFQSLQEAGIQYATIKLHEEFKMETEADIRTFLTKSFEGIRTRRRIRQDPWPEAEVLDQAVTHAAPLFIYAATLIRFIEPPGSRILNPTKQLKSWFQGCSLNNSHLSDVAKMYKLIMDCLLYGDDLENPEPLSGDYLGELQRLLGSLVVLAEPLSAPALTDLLDMDIDSVRTWLSNLHAVVYVPSDETSCVEIIHKSFSDFLVGDGGPEPQYRVNESETHLMLARRCMSRMSIGLHKNICKLKDPGTGLRDIPKAIIAKFIPTALEYASTHWIYHLRQSGWHQVEEEQAEVYAFLKKNILPWFEALCILGRLTDAGAGIGQLLATAVSHELVNLLKEGQKFLLEFGYPFEYFPLQIYGTGLAFSPSKSALRRLFWDSRLKFIQSSRGTPETWNPQTAVTVFDGPTGIHAIAISPDGHTMAIGGAQYLSIWDIWTGLRQQSLPDERWIIALSYLEDGKRIASLSKTGELLYWNLSTGVATKQCQLGSFDSPINGAVVLPAHSLIAARRVQYVPSSEGYVFGYIAELWDFQTGECRQVLRRDTPRKLGDLVDGSGRVALSPHGDMMAALSDDGIQLWDIESEDELEQLELPQAMAVAFAPNNHVIAAATGKGQVLLWDLPSRTCYHKLQCEIVPTYLEFLPTSSRLAVGNGHRRVFLVNLGEVFTRPDTVGHEFPLPKTEPIDHQAVISNLFNPKKATSDAQYGWIENPSPVERIALSPDQRTLATSSRNHNLLLWDLESGRLLHSLQPFAPPNRIVFSPDGMNLAVSHEMVIEVWEVSTGRRQWANEIRGLALGNWVAFHQTEGCSQRQLLAESRFGLRAKVSESLTCAVSG